MTSKSERKMMRLFKRKEEDSVLKSRPASKPKKSKEKALDDGYWVIDDVVPEKSNIMSTAAVENLLRHLNRMHKYVEEEVAFHGGMTAYADTMLRQMREIGSKLEAHGYRISNSFPYRIVEVNMLSGGGGGSYYRSGPDDLSNEVFNNILDWTVEKSKSTTDKERLVNEMKKAMEAFRSAGEKKKKPTLLDPSDEIMIAVDNLSVRGEMTVDEIKEWLRSLHGMLQ